MLKSCFLGFLPNLPRQLTTITLNIRTTTLNCIMAQLENIPDMAPSPVNYEDMMPGLLDLMPLGDNATFRLNNPSLEDWTELDRLCNTAGYDFTRPITPTSPSPKKTKGTQSSSKVTVGAATSSIRRPASIHTKSTSTMKASHSSTSATPSPPKAGIAMLTANHEESCAKCRMTEEEHHQCKMERRREQNRASQRKFRARKEAKIRDAATEVASLNTYIKYVEARNTELEKINKQLCRAIDELRQSSACTKAAPTPTYARKIDKISSKSISNSKACLSAGPRKPSSASNLSNEQGLFELHMPLFDHELLPPS